MEKRDCDRHMNIVQIVLFDTVYLPFINENLVRAFWIQNKMYNHELCDTFGRRGR